MKACELLALNPVAFIYQTSPLLDRLENALAVQPNFRISSYHKTCYLIHGVDGAKICYAEEELRSSESDGDVASPCLGDNLLSLRGFLHLPLDDVRRDFRLCQRRYQHLWKQSVRKSPTEHPRGWTTASRINLGANRPVSRNPASSSYAATGV